MRPNHYFDLIVYKTFADLRAETAKTYIGILWWVFDPIITMLIFYVVFGLLMKRGTEDFVPFLLIGLVIWQWFRQTIMHGANSIIVGRHLMKQVYIPKIIFPIIEILKDLVKFSIVLGILLVFLWIYGFSINFSYLALPFLLLTQFILIVSFTFLLAALVPFLPDIKVLAEHILQMLFFLSGIFFPGSSIPEHYQIYFYLNPMANMIELYRDVLMYGKWPNWSVLITIFLLATLLLAIAYWLLARNDHRYPKLMVG